MISKNWKEGPRVENQNFLKRQHAPVSNAKAAGSWPSSFQNNKNDFTEFKKQRDIDNRKSLKHNGILIGTIFFPCFRGRARHYDPETGRWTAKDPSLFNGGDTNLFGYVSNDPVNFIDPEGLYKFGPGAKGPLTPGLDSALQCFETCSGTSVTVTSAVRSESKGPHGSGNACDLGRNANPDLSRGTAEQCYQKCFNPSASFAQEENNNPNTGGTHFHFQNQPGRGGANDFRPGIAPYQP